MRKSLRPRPWNNEQGLSLIEVLVALSLAAILFVSVDLVSDTDREDLDSALEAIERAVHFSSNESVLRGSMIRVRFLLDENPQEFSVEAGPPGDFVLPSFEAYIDDKKLSLADQEKRDALLKTLKKSFNTVQEFQEGNYKLPSNVKILGVATHLRNNLVQDGEASFYLFPSGEKDATLIILSTGEEVVGLTIDPFTDKISREYKTLTAKTEDDRLAELEEINKSFYEEWKKE